MNRSDTQTTADTATYTASPQDILVPPNTTAQITVYLQEVKATGAMALHAELGGTFRTKIYWRPPSAPSPIEGWSGDTPLYDWLRDRGIPILLPPSLKLNPGTRSLSFNGAGTYTATYGTNFKVEVTYLPNGSGTTSQKTQVPTPYTFSVPARPAAT
jgi:hypothetical protein